jgi:hypothetical protein
VAVAIMLQNIECGATREVFRMLIGVVTDLEQRIREEAALNGR